MSCACKCDRCGKFYERTEEFNNRKHKLCELRNSFELDLCKECYSELEEWFTGCIQVRDCLHCKHSKNGKINSTETCHECMWENQFEKDETEDIFTESKNEDDAENEEDYLKNLDVYSLEKAISGACFHGECWVQCPHCGEGHEISFGYPIKNGHTIIKCNKCGKLFKD